jgi:predicted amidohydrolase YtcJ
MAHTLVIGGPIHTGDPEMPVVQALALGRGGRVMAVMEEVQSVDQAIDELSYILVGSPRVIDLEGDHAYPGFTDAHMHLQSVGERELTLNLEGSASIEEVQERLAARVALAEPGEWIVGRGWIETHWSTPRFLNRDDLDAVAPDHPVVLERSDGHALVANSRALAAGAIVAGRPDPFGGSILRDEAGEPTGMLTDNAMNLVTRMIPSSAEISLERALDAGIQRSLSMGLTTVHIAGASIEVAEELIARCHRGEYSIHSVIAVEAYPDTIDEVLAYVTENRYECVDQITMGAIKVSVDGALGSRGAALLEPYADADGEGYLTWTEEDLARIFSGAADAGLQIWTHAIGDRGNRIVLDAYERWLVDREDHRWRIEHAQHLSPEDLPRFAELGVIPSMQPSHAIGDLHFAPQRLGQERLAGAYAWRDLLDSGVVIPAGSDAPVEIGDPRIEFYAAVTRRDLSGFSGEGWHPEQAMTRAEALMALTAWPAYASFNEGRHGCLVPSCHGDITVVDADLMEIAEEDILSVTIVATIVDGELRYVRE